MTLVDSVLAAAPDTVIEVSRGTFSPTTRGLVICVFLAAVAALFLALWRAITDRPK